MRAAGAEVYAISTDDLSRAQHLAGRIGIPFPVLYDPSAEMVREYGVFDLHGDRLATPATMIIDRSGVVRWRYIGRNKRDRPTTAAVLGQLRELQASGARLGTARGNAHVD